MSILPCRRLRSSKDVSILRWLKGWKIERPPRPVQDPNEDGWEIGTIVQYNATQVKDNFELRTIELGHKALTLFAVSVLPPHSFTSLD